MSDREGLADLARAIADDAIDDLHAVAAAVIDEGVTLEVLEHLLDEGERAAPETSVMGGLMLLLETILTQLRLDIGDGNAAAEAQLESIRSAILEELQAERLGSEVIMTLGRCFATARVELGEDLREAIMARMQALAEHDGTDGTGDLAAVIAEAAEAAGGDPLVLHEHMRLTTINVMDAQGRAIVAAMLAVAEDPVVRLAALGQVLDADERVARAAFIGFESADASEPVEPRLIRWLARMTDWLPPERAGLAAATLQRLQPRMAGDGEPAWRARVLQAGPIDGGGDAGIYGIASQGRTHGMAMAMLALGQGFKDVVAEQGMPRRNAEAVMAGAREEAEAFAVPGAVVARLLATGIADGLAQGQPPPFALAAACDIWGFDRLVPHAETPEALLAEVLDGLKPAEIDAAAEAAAQAGWPRLRRRFATLDSWMETGAEVARVVVAARSEPEAAVLAEVLPAQRRAYAARCGWTALLMKAANTRALPYWRDLALLGRGWLSDAPLASLPMAREIAAATVARAREDRG